MDILKSFRYIIAVADAESISAAAETLGIAQPTLSKYILKLEKTIGAPLFDRSTIPLRLTEAGAQYVEAGRKMVRIEHQMMKSIDGILSDRNAVIRVGISPSRAPYLMPRILSAFHREQPGCKVVIEETRSDVLNDRLQKGELDVIVSMLSEDTAAFERVDLFTETLLLAVPAQTNADGAPAAPLGETPLIGLGRGQYLRDTLDALRGDAAQAPPDIECINIETAVALVRAGLGATIVPSYIAEYGAVGDGIRFLPVDAAGGAEHSRRVCAFYRKEQFLTPSEKRFLACAKSVCAPMRNMDTTRNTKEGLH